jgi:hypothetical protein
MHGRCFATQRRHQGQLRQQEQRPHYGCQWGPERP